MAIEYREYPPPTCLIKAMNLEHARKLCEGNLHLKSIEYYRKINGGQKEEREEGSKYMEPCGTSPQNEGIGGDKDVNEGKGMLKLGGNPMEVGMMNEVFFSCCAMPDTPFNKLLNLNKEKDTIIRITNVQLFIQRVIRTLNRDHFNASAIVGRIKYNRGEEVTKDGLNSQPFAFNLFQKNKEFEYQKEYRLAFIKNDGISINADHIDIFLEDCRDIIHIIHYCPDKINRLNYPGDICLKF